MWRRCYFNCLRWDDTQSLLTSYWQALNYIFFHLNSKKGLENVVLLCNLERPMIVENRYCLCYRDCISFRLVTISKPNDLKQSFTFVLQ